jgi:hypothetical protein
MHETVSLLMLEFLTWVSSRPRTYAETMGAWRSTCPRHTVWEDALVGASSRSKVRAFRINQRYVSRREVRGSWGSVALGKHSQLIQVTAPSHSLVPHPGPIGLCPRE